jgi:hypothetical protein
MATPESELVRVTDEAPESPQQSLETALDAAFPTTEPAPVATPAAIPAPAALPDAPTPETPAAEAPGVTPPVAEPEPEAPTPASKFSPLFELGEAPDALPRAQAILKEVHAYDPKVYQNVADAVYHNHPQLFRQWALQDLGVAPEKVTEFVQWAKSGAGELPNYLPPPFPTPDAVTGEVTLPNGLQLNVKDDPDHLERYENAKMRYDWAVEKQTVAAQQAKDTAAAETKRIADETKAREDQEFQRVADWNSGQLQLVGQELEKLKIVFTDEDDVADVVLGIVGRMETSEALKKLNAQALPYVKQGAGRSADFQRDAGREIRSIVAKVVNRFNQRALKTNQIERAALGNNPILPSGTKQVDAVTPPPPGSQPARTYQEIEERMLGDVANAFN